MVLAKWLCWVVRGSGWWIILFTIGLAAGIQAQPRQYKPTELRRQDSLRRLLSSDLRPDTVRVNRLYQLAFGLRTNEGPRAAQLFRESWRLARQLGYLQGLAHAEFGLGYCYRADNHYDSAQFYTQRSIKHFAQLGDGFNHARGLYNLARIYNEQGRYGESLTANLDGLAISQANHDRRSQLFHNIQLGFTNTDLDEYAAARQYFDQAQRLARTVPDPLSQAGIYTGLAEIYQEQGNWRLARDYYAKVAHYQRKVYNAAGMLPNELSLAEMNAHLAPPASELTAAYALRRRAAAGTAGQLARADLLLARLLLATGRLDSARYYGARSLAANQRLKVRREARDAARVLAQTNAQAGRWAAAYRHQSLATALADTLNGVATQQRAAAQQITFARSQQQIQICLLTQQTRLQAQQQELDRLRYRQQIVGFTALIGLLALLGGTLLWRTRRREAARQQALRTRIAADLHDEVGSALTQISMQSTLLREGIHGPAQQQAYLDQMQQASQRAARQMSDAVWSIDARHDSAASLLDRLRDHAHEVLPPAGVELDFAAEAGLETAVLPLATRQTLYYIYKEALHNVVKHAQARQVRVRLRRQGPELELEVGDDGRGLPGNGSSVGRNSGQGLANMRMRAAAVGGSVTFAAAGVGTAVVVRLPLR
ncbi:tetratricopeptide repeat protein [Hymenobacter sp. BT683]|uniref:Tetratricopeptide repeat protein n=1 Tax=Hymenobacter jeongseonensis TaxID=2791027 RepID=A0ABS0IDT7_9BACT|nr:tetratricopeptide repeat-containing sensor histidine kinase [Hymenobacter jeongseonensis]MBF9236015.1 tetratricopeptide repeat protein [Hymenobacter jeongseonensis]